MSSSSDYPPILDGSTRRNKETELLTEKHINKILLIEDNPADAKMVQLYLAESGLQDCTLTVRDTLSKGIEEIGKTNELAAVLLDLSLPDSSGLQTLEKLLSNYPNMNVIVLTGHSDKKLGLEAVKYGAQDFLVKGNYDADIFAKTIRFSIERKKFFDQLQEARLRYQNIFTNSKDGIYVCDFDGTLIDFNKSTSELVGYTANELQSFNIKSFFEEEEFWERFLERVRATNNVVEEEIEIICKDDSIKYCIISASKMAYGNFNGVNGFITDITEKKQAEKLREDRKIADKTNALKEQFIASISHEMRTPMNAILGMSNLVLKTDLD